MFRRCRHAFFLVLYALFVSVTDGRAADDKPIVIGGTLGLTGSLAGPSAEYKAVYDYWLSEIARKGGLLGRPVIMKIYNDESTPTVAQALYNRLIDQDQSDLLLAPFSTFVGGAIVPIVLSHRKLLFNGGFVGINIARAANGSIIGSYMYQEPDYTRSLFELVKSLPEQQRPKRVAILTLQNPFPIVVRDGIKGVGGALNFAKDAGLTVVLNEQYPPNTTDFGSLVQKAKAADADLLLELGLPDDSFQVVRTVQQLNYKPAMFCVCASQVSTLPAWEKIGSAAEDVFGSTFSWPTQGYKGLQDLDAFFRGRGYKILPAVAIAAYSSLQVIEQAVEGTKSLDQEKLKAYIMSNEFHTAGGSYRYQADGTPTFGQVLLQYHNGKNEPVWPKQLRIDAPVIVRP